METKQLSLKVILAMICLFMEKFPDFAITVLANTGERVLSVCGSGLTLRAMVTSEMVARFALFSFKPEVGVSKEEIIVFGRPTAFFGLKLIDEDRVLGAIGVSSENKEPENVREAAMEARVFLENLLDDPSLCDLALGWVKEK